MGGSSWHGTCTPSAPSGEGRYGPARVVRAAASQLHWAVLSSHARPPPAAPCLLLACCRRHQEPEELRGEPGLAPHRNRGQGARAARRRRRRALQPPLAAPAPGDAPLHACARLMGAALRLGCRPKGPSLSCTHALIIPHALLAPRSTPPDRERGRAAAPGRNCGGQRRRDGGARRPGRPGAF